MAMANTPTICAGSGDILSATGGVSYIWSSNAGGATIASVSITPSSSDTYTVTGIDANGCVNTSTVTVDVQNCTTGIEQAIGNSSSQLSVYPNPSTGNFTIENDKELGLIEVYDMLGNKVYSNNSKQTQEQIDIRSFANGMYSLKVNGNIIRVVKTN